LVSLNLKTNIIYQGEDVSGKPSQEVLLQKEQGI